MGIGPKPAFGACAFVVAIASAAAAPISTERMDRIAREYVDAKEFMGTVLVARGDEVLFSRAYGSANLEWNIPNAIDTKFRLGSVSKQFTAAAILLLEERGKLTVDDSVKKHYSEAPAAWDGITVAQLLTHTSGIPNFTSFPDYESFSRVPTTPADLVKLFRDKQLDFAPGAEMRYSNSGYALLGLIIESASGTTYAKFLDENIFEPLGMKDSGYDSNVALIPRRAAGYVPSPNGPENANYLSMTVPFAAGALYSTVGDLHRWNQGLFGGKVIDPGSLRKMITPPKGDYAFGIVVVRQAGRKALQHGGGIDGFNTKLSYFPDDGVTVVALSNINGPGAEGIVDKLGALVHGEPVALHSERKEIALPASTLKEYVGTYELHAGSSLAVSLVDGKLTVIYTGRPPDTLFAESRDHFFSKRFIATVEFVRSGGKVTHMILHHGSYHGKASKKS